MSDPGCFDRDRIDAYLVGALVESEIEQVRQHLADCPQCRAIAEELEEEFDSMSSNLVGLLRRPAPVAEYLDEPEFQRALAKADALRHEVSFFPARQAAGSPIQDPPHPEQLGQYQLLERLGRGGMGTVYKALHTKLRREVALKILPPERMDDAGSATRFLREMEAVGELDHPNIIRATDAAEVEGIHFLVMELVQGIDLHKLVGTCGPLATADACELIRQTAIGLQHAHEHGMVHRDIKPSNLILTSEGMVKVLDLGLARLRSSPAESQGLTESGQMMGTLDYMAPEQADDAHTVDIRGDIYSLGCTLYKLLTGHAPFSGSEYDRPIRKMMAHAQKSPPPVRQDRSDVPEGLQKAIDRLLAKDPADRYATPGAMADALGPFTAGCNLLALIAKAMASPTSGLEAEGARPADAESVSLATVSTDSGSEAEVVSASIGEAVRSREPKTSQVPAPIAKESRRSRFSGRHLVVAAIAVLLLIGAGILLSQIIIRIKGKGIVETEIAVPGEKEIEVERDGKVVAVVPAQPKGKAKASSVTGKPIVQPKRPSVAIRPEPVELEAGEPLSPNALVSRPASIKGVRSWTIETRGPRGTDNHGVGLGIAYSPNGRQLATAGEDAPIRVWDPDDGQLLRAFVGHAERVNGLAYSPDGKTLASGSSDGTLRLWDAESAQLLHILERHAGMVHALAWSPDGKTLASSDACGSVWLWDVAMGAAIMRLPNAGVPTRCVAWSPDGKMLAAGSDDKSSCLFCETGAA